MIGLETHLSFSLLLTFGWVSVHSFGWLRMNQIVTRSTWNIGDYITAMSPLQSFFLGIWWTLRGEVIRDSTCSEFEARGTNRARWHMSMNHRVFWVVPLDIASRLHHIPWLSNGFLLLYVTTMPTKLRCIRNTDKRWDRYLRWTTSKR